jgi:protein required for attachment to host cells
MKPVRTLILVADDVVARILVNDGVGKGLREVAGLSARQFPGDRPRQAGELYQSSHGASSGQVRHGIDPRTSVHEHARENFVRHVVEALDRQWRDLRPDRLIVAAPAKVLGVLRARLSGAPAQSIHAELGKDLTGVPLHDLGAHFEDVLAV